MQYILLKEAIHNAVARYNKRIAKHLALYMGWDKDEILKIINLMEDNKDENFWGI